MNYYWWELENGRVGNLYAKNSDDARTKLLNGISNSKITKLKLLEENVLVAGCINKNKILGGNTHD